MLRDAAAPFLSMETFARMYSSRLSLHPCHICLILSLSKDVYEGHHDRPKRLKNSAFAAFAFLSDPSFDRLRMRSVCGG